MQQQGTLVILTLRIIWLHTTAREKKILKRDKFCPLKCYIVKWWVILHGTRRAIFPVQTPPSGRHIPCKSGCTMPLVVVTRCCLLTFVGILRQWEHICLSGKSELFISFVAGCQLLWSLLLHQGSFLKMQVAVGHEIQKRGRVLQWQWVILHELGRGGLWDQKWGWTVISAQSNFAFNLKTCCNLINSFVFNTQSTQTVMSGRLLQPSSLKTEVMPAGTPTSLSVLVTLVTALTNILKKGPWTATVPGHTAGNKLV